MRAVVVDRWMEPAELVVRELPDPVVGPGQLGIDVKAAGCNFFDILIVQGRYQVKPPFPFIPGGEIAGVVREIGETSRSPPISRAASRSATACSRRRRWVATPIASRSPRRSRTACPTR